MKTTTIGKYDIDIENIQKKIQQVQDDLSGSEMKSFIPKTLLKDMDDLQKKLEKFRKTSPVSTSTHKDIEKFLKDWERVSVELDDLDSKMSKISFSDTGIKENIKEVSELVNKYKEAVKARKDYAEKITSENGVKNVTGGIYRAKLETKRNKMAEAATKGGAGIEEIKSIAQDGRDDLKDRLNWINQNRTNTEIIKKETKEVEEQLKLWNAIEQSALRYAENQQRNIDNENEINTELQKQIQFYKGDLSSGLEQRKNDVHLVKEEVENTTVALKQMSAETLRQEERQSNINTMTSRIKDMFSAATVISTIRHIVHGAIQDFQELDKQFNEIAIVSDYSTKEMWSSFSKVNKVAQEFGVETKNVLEVQNLYYHQGKDMAEVNKLTAQTLTLAKITGMDYERATSDLTAALNAYNIAAEDAVRVTDTIAAMDTNAAISSEELMTALTKTASIAANAGMSLESTEVFVTKMIETTREAPENLGTALKTIIARFGEVKQEIDGEEIELADINRVDTALKSIGISLLDTAGQIRDLDGVFMELSAKWDDLDRNTQRYIATIAAGSRQQSRFIAMMEDYDRTLELTEIAQNSAGLGARQLAKSQESIETSVNRLKSTWQEFYSSLITSGMIKGVLELANGILSLVNTLNDVSPFLGTIITALTIWAIKTQIADRLVLKLGQSLGQAAAQTTANTTALKVQLKSLEESQLATMLADETTEEYIKTLIKEEIQLRKNAVAQNTLNQAKKRNMTIKNKKELGRVKVNKQFETTFNNNIDKGTSFKNIIRDAWSSGKQASLGGNSNNIKNWRATLKNNFSRPDFAINNFKSVFSSKGGIGQVISGKLTSILPKITSFITKIATILPKIISLVTKLLNPITALIAALTIGFAIYRKYTKLSLDDTKKVEKLQKSQEEYNKTLKEYNDLKEKAKIIEKYSDRKNLSAEQLQEQQEAAKALVNEYPELLNRIDEEGNYYLKDAEAIQAVIDKKQELLDQEATNYTELRLKYAQEGIYADETTSAGKTMKNIQSYAASLDEDQLKEAAKEIDAAWKGVQFNSSNYKKMMKAFGEGKKFSFDEKDMSSLFEGDISEDNWNEFLEAVKENPMILESEEDMAKALKATHAYSGTNAKQVAEAFMKMNEENGKLFSQLIQGAAEEYSQIEISQAKITIAKGDFEEDLSSELTDALSQAAVDNAKKKHINWDNLDEKKRTEYTKEETQAIVDEFEKLTKTQIQGLNAVFTSANVGALKVSELETFDIEADTEHEQEKALQAFWDVLPAEIQHQFPREQIPNLSAEVIETLFELIKNTIGDTNVDEIVSGLISDFNTSNTMYEGTPYEINKNLFEGLTLDQIQALTNRTGAMSTEQIAPYLSTTMTEYQKALDSLDAESATKVFNILAKADLATQDGIEGAIKDLSQFGYTAEQVWDIAVKTSNGIGNISLDDFASATERAKKELDSLASKLEGATALMEGTASFEQLSTYMNDMLEYWTQTEGITRATELISQLGDSVVATGDGFKIGATAGAEYANSAVEMTKQLIILRIAQQELAMETEIANDTLTDQAKANYEMTIALMRQQYAMIDAQSKKSVQDGLVKDLEKAKEKADELVDSLKALVDWLRGYDRYANLDGVISTLEEDFEHLDFEINFSTNTDVIEKDLQEQVDNINTQIFANQGGIRAAEEEQSMWQDVINKRNSQYVSFDASGNAIVNAEKLRELQEDIADASEERKPVLQAEYDEIMDNVEAYNKAKDKVEDYSKALEENFKALEDYLKANYEAIMKVENKLIDARMAAEDKELEKVKEKYEAIKEENDKYLEDVQEMIDKEREIRDRADKEQDVKDKEKKLAMMRMDTSGIYASDIRALEEELEGDYRDLEDDAVDKAIADLEKEYQTQAEILDKEVDYLESSLEYRREIMTEYNQWAQEMMMQGSDTVIEYLKANDEEYYTGTAAAQANWVLEWNNAVAQGVAANNTMATTLDPVMRNLETCQTNANGFEGAVQQYSETALAMNPEVNSTVEELVTQYSNLADGVDDVEFAMDRLAIAYRDAADAAVALKAAQDTIVYGQKPSDEDIDNKVHELKNNNSSNNKISGRFMSYQDKDNTIVRVWEKENYIPTGITANNTNISGMTMVEFTYTPSGEKIWFDQEDIGSDGKPKLTSMWWKKYAKGGYVDFTGPAWVDGTKSHPEYMLNATQTAQFETLVAALNNLYGNGMSSLKQSSQKIGDAYYNFHINVEQMASDYDVDQLVSRLEQKMVDSSKYRNITLLKKSQ